MRSEHRALAGTCLAAAAAAAAVAAAPAFGQTASCAALADFTMPGVALEIDRAADVPAARLPARGPTPEAQIDLPAHCLVEGAIDRRTGVDGKPYAIGFALALPAQWNGRFLFQGGGGLNGAVQPPIGALAAGDRPALARGFAVVSTDTGHRGAGFDASFFADQEAMLNFLYVANGKLAPVAKALIAAYYTRPPEHSYFVGCSTGGREAMIMSQRYPGYFDGIVAGAPAMRTGFSNLGMRSVSVALAAAAARDASGAPLPGTALTDIERRLVVDAAVAACDAHDGLEDRMIFDTQACDFSPASLICDGPKTDTCLSRMQADAIADAMDGPRDAAGLPVYTGYLYDTGLAASGPGTIPGVLHGASSPVGPATPPTTQDVDAEAVEAASAPSALGDTNHWTNLRTFSGNGGKLLFFHGNSDPWFSALDTVGYYERLAAASGGAGATRQWSRLFLVPGMGHCAGGEAALDRFDLLTPLVEWVETGKAPDSVVASGAAFPGRTRPLCPYPQVARYRDGDPNDAASFECRD